jgi:ankyrin repeat protein
LLAAEGVDVNQANNAGGTALHIVAAEGHTEIVKQLLAAGADVNQAGANGWTALHRAAQEGYAEIVAQLLAVEGVDVNQANKNGWTALLIAAYNGHVEIVAQLLAAGADVNLVIPNGSTALHEAAIKGHAEIVAQLLAYGADETLLTEEQQARYAEVIAEGRAILIRNTRNSACALADIGQELQRVSIIQNHPSREQAESQAHENKLPELTEPILAQIAAYATELPMPNSLTQEQIKKCAEVGTESLASTDANTFNETDEKFVARAPGNTIENILNGNQNPANGQGLGG